MARSWAPDSPAAGWISPGRRVDVDGYHIAAGLFYFTGRTATPGVVIDPSAIDPKLPVKPPPASVTSAAGAAPAGYSMISPELRGGYLRWLAGGRRTDVPACLVLLFCCGLERRVLVDAVDDPAVRHEVPTIAAEVRRLRARYGEPGGRALRTALDQLLDLLELLGAPRPARRRGTPPTPPPAPHPPAEPGHPTDRIPPIGVRVALAGFAATATPVPAGWARAWVRHHPSLRPRPTQRRCPVEFDRLLELRYRDRHGAGLVLPDDGPGIRLRYQPVNPSLTTTLVCREDLPDVLAEPTITRALGWLADDVADALDPYGRWVARFPQARDSLAAAPLLPPELLDTSRGRLGALRIWTEVHLGDRALAVVDAGAFAAFWSTANPARMTSDEAAGLSEVLALIGTGVEPDVRFGAPALAAGPAVLFRLTPAPTGAADRGGAGGDRGGAGGDRGGAGGDRGGAGGDAGARLLAATAVARCAAAVASAGGAVDPGGRVGAAVLATTGQLATALRLEPPLRDRLSARLAWLLATGVNVDRLGRQVTSLGEEEREVAGRYLIPVAAAADPALGPATVTVLARVYRLLGLDRAMLFSRLHECGTTGPRASADLAGWTGEPHPRRHAGPDRHPDTRLHPDGGADRDAERIRRTDVDHDEPVVVRPEPPAVGGYALPWAPAPDPTEDERDVAGPRTTPSLDTGPTHGGLRLDPASVSRKFAESEAVAALLDTIFEADEPPSTGCSEPTVPGLDLAHSRLLRALAARPSWSVGEFAALASAQGVLPDGALDLLNETAIDATGAPVVDGDDTLVVDIDILEELLGGAP